jgi:hypothetical protein
MKTNLIQKTLAVAVMTLGFSMAYAEGDFSTVIEGAVSQTQKNGENNVQVMQIKKGVKISNAGGRGSGKLNTPIDGIDITLEGGGGKAGSVTQSQKDGTNNRQIMSIGGD